MKKKILWFLIIGLLLTVGYLASLSDSSLDNSLKFVEIDSHLGKQEMSNDIDTLFYTFEKINPNPYRFIERSQFISEIDSIKGQLPDSLTTINFWRIIDQITCKYNDAHSYVEGSYVLADFIRKDRLFFPFSAKIHNDKILVSSNEDLEQILPVGTEIKKINGISNQELIIELLKHSIKETHSLKLLEISDDFGFYLWKTYDWDAEFEIHYESNDSHRLDSVTVKGIKWEKRKRIAKDDKASLSFAFLEEDIGYIKIIDFNGSEKEINNFYDESFNLLKERNSSNLILDFSGHSGGRDSYGEDLAKYIAKEPYRKLSKGYWKITTEFKDAFDRRFVPKGIRWFKPIYLVNEYSKVFYGAEPNELVTVNYELKDPLPEEKRFLGEVYLITDHNTFSAGSIFAEMFKYYNMGTIVGQPTGNLYSFNGFPLANFTLPNSKLSFQVSSVYNVGNNKEEGLKSVEPDHFVDLSDDPLSYILENLIR